MQETAAIDIINLPIKYNKRRKHLAIVQSRHNLEVRAPDHLDESFIRQWLSEQETEIRAKLVKFKSKPSAPQAPSLIDLADNRQPNYFHLHGEYQVYSAQHSIAKKEKMVRDYLISKVESDWLEQINQYTQQLNVSHKFKQMRLKRTKSKWGHCTTQGVIQLNWLLAMAPKEIQHYVIAHEVCHLLEMNHSAKFWAWVESINPNYKQHRKWLKDNGYRMQW